MSKCNCAYCQKWNDDKVHHLGPVYDSIDFRFYNVVFRDEIMIALGFRYKSHVIYFSK